MSNNISGGDEQKDDASYIPLNARLSEDPDHILSVRDENQDFPEEKTLDFRKNSSLGWSTDRLTHQVHKHPATFIPQIPHFLLQEYLKDVNHQLRTPLIMDPFCGSGTTGVEAQLLGCNFVGFDLNPLSVLTSKVSTKPIPPSLINQVQSDISEKIQKLDQKYYKNYDPQFPNQNKHHWFEDQAILDLTTIHKTIIDVMDSFHTNGISFSDQEEAVMENWGTGEKNKRVRNWLALAMGSSVFDLSNADPNISKAYKSPIMKEKISNGTHPPDGLEIFKKHVKEIGEKISEFWWATYNGSFDGFAYPRGIASESETTANIILKDFPNHRPTENIETVDLVITSPPYINAINYYRGSKLRLFWLQELMEDFIAPERLRKELVGSNSGALSNDITDRAICKRWMGSQMEFDQTSLPDLDEDLQKIRESDHSEAENRACLVFKYFAVDMVKSLTNMWSMLKPGGKLFLLIGPNVIAGREIPSHKYIADIATNLGKLPVDHDSELNSDVPEFKLHGFGLDKIENRGLFKERAHGNGCIEGEWLVVLEKV